MRNREQNDLEYLVRVVAIDQRRVARRHNENGGCGICVIDDSHVRDAERR